MALVNAPAAPDVTAIARSLKDIADEEHAIATIIDTELTKALRREPGERSAALMFAAANQ